MLRKLGLALRRSESLRLAVMILAYLMFDALLHIKMIREEGLSIKLFVRAEWDIVVFMFWFIVYEFLCRAQVKRKDGRSVEVNQGSWLGLPVDVDESKHGAAKQQGGTDSGAPADKNDKHK